MSFDGMNNKQLRERMRFLSDKIDSIWVEITPKLNEFKECRSEFNRILEELVDRGESIDGKLKTESRETSS